MELTDYRVRVLDGTKGTGAVVRVLIEMTDGEREWTTVGVSENIIQASYEALAEAYTYGLLLAPAGQCVAGLTPLRWAHERVPKDGLHGAVVPGRGHPGRRCLRGEGAVAPLRGVGSAADGPMGADQTGMTPRVRDMPAPRRAKGLVGPAMAKVFAWPFRWALAGLLKAGFHPWQLTVLSLVFNVIAAWLLLAGQRTLPAVVLMVAGLLDVFDGSVARARGEATRWGAFLDSTLDRVADVLVFGALFWSLSGQGHTPRRRSR